MMYVMDMVMAGVLLFVSVCLILIAFLILRFTIVFTINEEYHDIGVMKAIGIKSRKIRSLYVIKYLAIALVGALVGAILSAFLDPFLLKGLLSCDLDRATEVLQNIIENAIKYSDGKYITNDITKQEAYQLITIANSGCSLSPLETPYIFNSFWRGSNVKNCGGTLT